MLKTYQFKNVSFCKGDSHSSKTPNIILPGLMMKQRWTSLRLQAKYSRLFNLGEMSCFNQHDTVQWIWIPFRLRGWVGRKRGMEEGRERKGRDGAQRRGRWQRNGRDGTGHVMGQGGSGKDEGKGKRGEGCSPQTPIPGAATGYFCVLSLDCSC